MVLKEMMPKTQSGVALITILLVVVIATVLGVSMITEQNFAINRAQSSFNQTIARQYTLGGEELARQILHQDFIDAPQIDHLGEGWSQGVSQFEFEEGEVVFQIEDVQSKFNLNSLVLPGQPGLLAQERFKLLLSEQGMDHSFVDRIKDWLDENDSVSPLGAESYEYLGLERPYRTGDQLMSDVTELRLILEFENPQFNAISPFVSTLLDPSVSFNINTVMPKILLILAPGLSLAEAETIVSNRDSGNPYTTLADFTGDPALSGSANSVKVQGLGVQSNFFQVNIRARYQDRYANLTSILQRDAVDGSMRVVYRDQSRKVVLNFEETNIDSTND
ncbi:MAG: general secretion pathway protein K [Flavobacterium sp.]|jgi:general secretion pathway protein K